MSNAEFTSQITQFSMLEQMDRPRQQDGRAGADVAGHQQHGDALAHRPRRHGGGRRRAGDRRRGHREHAQSPPPPAPPRWRCSTRRAHVVATYTEAVDTGLNDITWDGKRTTTARRRRRVHPARQGQERRRGRRLHGPDDRPRSRDCASRTTLAVVIVDGEDILRRGDLQGELRPAAGRRGGCPNGRRFHAQVAVLRRFRPVGQHDRTRRDRQQHRQQQHHRLQVRAASPSTRC